ncbi:MAG: AAA family ATPase [Fuerstiella sp.]
MCSRKRHRSIDLDDNRRHNSANGLQDAGFCTAESAALLAPRMVLNMYEQRFGLHRKPFQTVTKTQDFFASSSFNELLPSVVHALQTDLGVAVLTGPAGVGKSASLEQIQRNLESTAQTLLLRGGSVKGSADLLYLLHRRLLKLQPDGAQARDSSATEVVRRYEVVERLERVASFWGPLTILLDDAQLVDQSVFSELRSLLEEGHDGRRFARLLIAGPLLLEEVLADSANSHFARKIRTHSFLQPLRSDESIQYLGHHFSLAGGDLSQAFASDALELIVAAADGVPQCLNLLADESLMVCEDADRHKVTREFVTQALTRLQHLPYSWNVSMVAETHDDELSDGEFGSASGTLIGENSIEIGEFPPDTFSNSNCQSTTSHVAEGVFEIGAPQPVTQAATSDETVAEVELNDQQPAACESESSGQAESLLESVSMSDLQDESLEIETSLPHEFEVEDRFEDAVGISQDDFEALEVSPPSFEEDSSTSGLLLSDSSTEVRGLAEFVDGEDDVDGCDSVDLGSTQVADSVLGYEPWAPAGEWPAKPVASPADGVLELEPSDPPIPSDPDGIEHAASTRGGEEDNRPQLTEPVWDNVATPVVDRFTWAELGRTPSDTETFDDTPDLPHHDATLKFATAWPPVTAGVAPTSQIPVSKLDDEYAELLHDLGLLIDAAAGRDASVKETHEDSVGHPLDASSPAELMASSKGPDGAIEELQQLIQEEQQLDQGVAASEEYPQMQVADDAQTQMSAVSDSSQPHSDSHAPMAAPRFFSMSQADGDDQESRLDDESGSTGFPPGGPELRTEMNVASTDTAAGLSDGPDPDVVAFERVVEERDEWMEQEFLLSQMIDEELAEEEQSLPTVLRQARQHRSILTMGLRQAAGAETLGGTPAVSSESGTEDSGELAENLDQDRPISLPMPEVNVAADVPEVAVHPGVPAQDMESSEKGGFSNLFTRLRRRRGKAS